MQFTINSLARLLANVEREVLISAIDEANLQALFRRDEILEAIAAAHAANPFIMDVLDAAKRDAEATLVRAREASFLNPFWVVYYLSYFITAVFHDLILTFFGQPKEFAEYILFADLGDPEEPPEAPPEAPISPDTSEILDHLAACNQSLQRILNQINALSQLVAEYQAHALPRRESAVKMNRVIFQMSGDRAQAVLNKELAINLIREL